MDIRLGGILHESLVNGTGIRRVIFMQGCFHKCPGCHNPSSWDKTGGELFDIDSIVDDIRDNSLLDGVTISGGEPFMQIEELFYILKALKAHDINVWVYTGFKYETIKETLPKILKYIDVLVDGKFIKELTYNAKKFTGSSNQRIIDIELSNEWGAVIEVGQINNSIHRAQTK